MASSRADVNESDIYGAVGEFDDENDLLAAIEQIRAKGYSKLEAYTPFPIHGIDEALGSKPSKLGWFIFCCGATGATCAATFLWWTSAVSYPIVVGGKPLFAFTYSIPIMFELMILSSAFAAVFGMFGLNRLPQLYHPIFNYKNADRINDDGFVLAIEAGDAKFDAEECVKLLESTGAKYAEVVAK